MDKISRFLYNLPYFRGRDRILSALRRAMKTGIRELAGDIQMELDPTDWTEYDLIVKGSTEPQTLALLNQLLDPGDTFVDIGCHVGFHTLIAAQICGKTGKVVAVDPQPSNCAKALRNIAINDLRNISLVTAAIAIEDGWVKLAMQDSQDSSRLSLAEKGVNDLPYHYRCPTLTLDSLAALHSLEHINLLKVDVEGFELEVLNSGMQMLDNIDNIIFELLPETPTLTNDKIVTLLNSHGFKLQQVDGSDFNPGQMCIENNVWGNRQ